ncbi:hypothetical protein JW906_07105 [bacterium]|nr:hypothetical protein [bacterium]
MRVHLFARVSGPVQRTEEERIHGILEQVALGTDTEDLVTAVYILPGHRQIRGTAYCMQWLEPKHFRTGRGKWECTQKFGIPQSLPARYKLIRIRLDGEKASYPRTEKDLYGWTFRYSGFEDHLALLFAHELHHFRRYHLNLHPREGEHRANQWALDHVRGLGFRIEAEKPDPSSRKRKPALWKRCPWLDPFRRFRSLSAGSSLMITHDPDGRYSGERVTLVRPPRADARRLVVRTPDGRDWRWPMAWLSPDALIE